MPLILPSLSNQLVGLFRSPEDTVLANAQRWGQIMQSYASTIAPPSISVPAASAALVSQLTSAFQSPSEGNRVAELEQAFRSFALILGQGMAPAFTATPPPGLVGFASIFSSNNSTQEAAAQIFAARIHAWLLTGTAVNNASGVTVIWN